MKLPNAERAFIDIRKLRDYCLNPQSPKGRNKARVFYSVFGIKQKDAQLLVGPILQAARSEDCIVGERDEFGRRYSVDFEWETALGQGRVRTGWVLLTKHDE